MEKRRIGLLTLIFILAIAWAGQGLFAGTKPKDIIPMNNAKYKKHRYNTVQFPHAKHINKLKLKCGDCHHNEKGAKKGRLDNLKLTDNVQSCIACHKTPGRKPGKVKMKKKEKIKVYHAEALHAKCKGCHGKVNKKATGKRSKGPAPNSCKKCHLGGKKK